MMLTTWSIPSAAITTMTTMTTATPRCTSASGDILARKDTGPTTSSGPNTSGGRTGNTGPDPLITIMDTGDIITVTGDMVITATGDMATTVIIGASRAQLFVIIDASFKMLNFFKYLLFMEKKQVIPKIL